MHTITSTLRTLGKIFRGRHIEIVSHFSQKTGFDISCKLSPMKTICMTCQTLIFLFFFGVKNKKIITTSLSAEFSQTVVNVKGKGLPSRVVKLLCFLTIRNLP